MVMFVSNCLDGTGVEVPPDARTAEKNAYKGSVWEKLAEVALRLKYSGWQDFPSFNRTCPVCNGFIPVPLPPHRGWEQTDVPGKPRLVPNSESTRSSGEQVGPDHEVYYPEKMDEPPVQPPSCPACKNSGVQQGIHEYAQAKQDFSAYAHCHFTLEVGEDPSIWMGVDDVFVARVDNGRGKWRVTLNLRHAFEFPRFNHPEEMGVSESAVRMWGIVLAQAVREIAPNLFVTELDPEFAIVSPYWTIVKPELRDEWFLSFYGFGTLTTLSVTKWLDRLRDQPGHPLMPEVRRVINKYLPQQG